MSNPAVYAAGGRCGERWVSIVATNLLEGNTRIPDYAGIPSVVFTTPPLARVGLVRQGVHPSLTRCGGGAPRSQQGGEGRHRRVVQRIRRPVVHPSPRAARLHQPHAPQHAKMMGYQVLG